MTTPPTMDKAKTEVTVPDVDELMEWIDKHGAARWATGATEQARDTRNAAHNDQAAQELRAIIRARIALYGDAREAAALAVPFERGSWRFEALLNRLCNACHQRGAAIANNDGKARDLWLDVVQECRAAILAIDAARAKGDA